MGRLYVKTLWRFSRKVGEIDDSGNIFFRWRDEIAGSSNKSMEIYDQEIQCRAGRVDGSGKVFDNDGVEVGWVRLPALPIFRAKVYAPTEERWWLGGVKWYGKAGARLWTTAELRRKEYFGGGAAILLLLKGLHEPEMSKDVDEAISNWDLVYLTSLIFTLFFPGINFLFSDLHLIVPALGRELSFVIATFLAWVIIFLLLSLGKRQVSAGRASYARDFRKKYLDPINRRTGLTGRGKGPGWRGLGFDFLGVVVSAIAAIYFLENSLHLFPLAVAGVVAFSTLWLKANARPWDVLPRYRKAPLPPEPQKSDEGDDLETRGYTWRFDGLTRGRSFEAEIKFRRSNVAAARAENPFQKDPVPDRHQAGRKLVLEGEKSDEVLHLAYQLRRIAVDNRLTEYEEIQNTLDFVQDIPYAFDKDSIDRLTNQALGILDYWRYPIETLYDENGDCDCKAVLAAALFRLVGFRALLLVSFDPDVAHAAVAVEGAPDFPQTDFFTDNQGRRYYFCETTGSEFTVGEQPSPGFAGRFEIIGFD
jgi:hypothetical protein